MKTCLLSGFRKWQMTRSLLFPVLLTLLCLTSALAQQVRDLSGKVTDENGESLPGVTVLVKGTTNGTATNNDGNFTIAMPSDNAILVFSFIGYLSKEVTVGNATNLRVTLSPDAKALEEVVVIGYGEVRKRDLTGSVVSVKGDEVAKVPATTVIEALQGKIPGADITRSNGYAGRNATIRVRGNRSISNPGSSNNPLYIVDGVQGIDVSVINPNDIESIEVLKDASSTAIYGSRGANGIIIITTKKGSTKPRFSFNTYSGISEVAGYGKYMTGPEYLEFRRQAYKASGNWSSPADDSKIGLNAKMLEAVQNGQYTEWPELLINNGLQQDYQLGISGGSDKTKVYFSGNYYKENGILKNDEFRRYTARLNVDQTINNWMKIGMQTQVAYTDNDQRRDPFNVASKIAPLGTPYNSDGSLDMFPGLGTEVNPLADEQPGAYKKNVQNTRGTVATYLELNPLSGLNFKSVFSATLTGNDQGTFYARNTIDGKGASSRAENTGANNRFFSWENIATYKKDIQDHSLGLTGVTSYLSNVATSNYVGGSNQLFENQLYYNLTGIVTQPYYGSNYQQHDLLSYAGRFHYDYKGKYLLDITGRYDGSSKLGQGHKWAFFPSAAVAWRISDEPFLANQNLLNDLKLRASYGIAGNDVIAPYETQNSLSQIQLSWDETNIANAYALNGNIGNPELKWETTATTDIGLDFGILKNRISGSIDYYDAITNDLIFRYNLPPSTGRATVPRNIGQTRNRGIEVALHTNNVSNSKFTWTSSINFFKNKEEIVTLPNGNVIDNDYRRSLIVGQPAQVFYDYDKIGIWQLGEETEASKYGSAPGDIKVRDISGPNGVPDGKIDPQYDRTIIGTTVPKWNGGLTNNISYRGFDLNVLLFARVGQWASSDYYGKYRRNGQNNNPRVDYWTPENPTNAFPSPHSTRTYNYVTTTTLYETSYVKLRNVTFGYTLPKALTNRFKADNLRLYVSGKNLYSFSKFKDFDPESEGITDQPLFRLYVAGVNLTF